jgi:hypothetical protein
MKMMLLLSLLVIFFCLEQCFLGFFTGVAPVGLVSELSSVAEHVNAGGAESKSFLSYGISIMEFEDGTTEVAKIRAHAGDVATMRVRRFAHGCECMVALVMWGGGLFSTYGLVQTGFLKGFWGFRKSYSGTGITIPVKKKGQEQKKQESSGFLQELPT